MPTVEAPDLPALLDRYERPLVRYAQSILGDLDAARDVVQDTFIRWVQKSREEDKSDPYSPESSLVPGASLESEAPWLFTVCRNRATDFLRKEGRVNRFAEGQAERLVAADPRPGAGIERAEQHAAVLRLVEKLPPTQQEVVRLKCQNGDSYQEISRITSLSVTNVGFILHTAIKRLRQDLAAQPE